MPRVVGYRLTVNKSVLDPVMTTSGTVASSMKSNRLLPARPPVVQHSLFDCAK